MAETYFDALVNQEDEELPDEFQWEDIQIQDTEQISAEKEKSSETSLIPLRFLQRSFLHSWLLRKRTGRYLSLKWEELSEDQKRFYKIGTDQKVLKKTPFLLSKVFLKINIQIIFPFEFAKKKFDFF